MTSLTTHQLDAVRVVSACLKGIRPQPLVYLAGFAGTGKSTILPDLLEATGIHPDQILFCAPTAKAAAVMRRKLLAQNFPNTSTCTIHSAIYRAKPAPINTLEEKLTVKRNELRTLMTQDASSPVIGQLQKLLARMEKELEAAYRDDDVEFQLNPDSIVRGHRLIVVDEASMVGSRMAADLMSFGIPILAIGDPGQLPPVQDSPGLTAGKPDFTLTEIHRQALDSPILWLANLARNGEQLPMGKHGEGVEVLRRKEWDPVFDPAKPPKFLCGLNKTRWKTTQQLRTEFGFIDDPKMRRGPQVGEPLIVTRNNRDYPALINGTEARAVSSAALDEGRARFMLSFECEEGRKYSAMPVFQGRFEENYTRQNGVYSCSPRNAFIARKKTVEMDFAWTLTVHRTQGSQYDDVVLFDESNSFRDSADQWAYTGLTRAAKTLTVLV